VNATLLPAARVTGRESQLIVNSEVLMLAEVTVILEPLAVSDAVMLFVWPTLTLPKLTADGPTANCPATVAVPTIEMVRVGLEASDTTEIDPDLLPPVVGVNTTPKVKL